MTKLLDETVPQIVAGIADGLGLDADDTRFLMTQVIKLSEECGEVCGAYLRAAGFARRNGDDAAVDAELADVVITARIIAHLRGTSLADAIDRKLAVVLTRGYKDPA